MDIYSLLASIIVAAFTGYVTFRIQERRLKQELKTEYMAERVAKELLGNERWQKRSFAEIEKRLGGFEKNELRKILVRAGAVQFEKNDGDELWGLLSRNKESL